MEDVSSRQQVSFSFTDMADRTSTQFFQNSTPEKSTNIWRIERDGISEKKFEAARTHFFRDAFVAVRAVTVVVAYKLPGMCVHMWYLRKKKNNNLQLYK